MSFASAFLDQGDDDLEHDVQVNIATLLQAVSPECAAGVNLPNVQASILCYGIPMHWALAEGRNSRQMRSTLKERLMAFEPRLKTVSEIDLQEDDQKNTVKFFVSGTVKDGGTAQPIEVETRLSRLDQHIEEGL